MFIYALQGVITISYKEEKIKNNLIRCHSKEKPDIRFQDGALRHAVGVKNYQVVRACRHIDYSMDGFGWTYNHAPMLAYWNNRFILEYLSNPVSEHVPPSQSFICTSKNGVNWSKPMTVFPPIKVSVFPYKGPKKELLTEDTVPCICHQRMGFYVSKSGKLLVLGFYGISPEHHCAPNNGYGVGRVVREVFNDFSMSDIYFIRYNELGGYNKQNVDVFQYYKDSKDNEFIEACDELLNNTLVTQQWWEEERLDTDFFTRPNGKALSYYTLPDGDVMGVFKNSMASLTKDSGKTWSQIEKCYSLETSTGKVWGQKTSDNKYVLCYNPTTNAAHRWPLSVVTSKNGTDFDNMLTITPEVSPCRYSGLLKNLGPQYVRGICEDNPQSKDKDMWLTYSVNKEDIWVVHVPVPIKDVETQDISEDFNDIGVTEEIKNWNIYAPAWAKVFIDNMPTKEDKSICLTDSDPYDRPRAMRIIAPATVLSINTRIMVDKLTDHTEFTIELQDRYGRAPTSIVFKNNNNVYVIGAGLLGLFCEYNKNEWLDISIHADCVKNECLIKIKTMSTSYEKTISFSQSVPSIERVLFTTKRNLPWQTLEDSGKYGSLPDLPSDVPTDESRCYINKFSSKTIKND